MAGVLVKLNQKGHERIVVINAPESFEAELALAEGVAVDRKIPAKQAVTFALAFVTAQKQVDTLGPKLAARMEGDAVLWMAYPKGSSKRYRCEFNRDTGWAVLGELGFEPVRQVAIDEDWSALRFRRVEYIRSFTRRESMAQSAAGKARAATHKKTNHR